MSLFTRTLALVASSTLIVAIGCGGEPRTAGKSSGSTQTKPAGDPSAQPRDTLNKTTQKVYDLKEELAKGGVISDHKISASDPLSATAGAYAPTVGKLGTMKADMDLKTYYAMNERYPANLQEFLTEIIKVDQPDGIQLPMLPYYQEYAYDSENHKLVVVEYPARKAQRQKELESQY
jgi:hypothetical protein